MSNMHSICFRENLEKTHSLYKFDKKAHGVPVTFCIGLTELIEYQLPSEGTLKT